MDEETTSPLLEENEADKVLEKYDPMKLDYFNPEYNSYDGKEPAPGLANPTYSISKALIRLYVDGIPFSLDETGLKNLFSKHGSVLEVRIFRRTMKDTRSGLVSYASRAEASSAIDAIHDMEPLFLRVFFSNQNEEPPSEEELAAEKIYLQREKLYQEFEENRGVHWTHLTPLSDGPASTLKKLIDEEVESVSWISPIFRSEDLVSHFSLSSKHQFDRKVDYLKAQIGYKRDSNSDETETTDDDSQKQDDEIYEIGTFFGPPIPFHKISDYIKKRNIISGTSVHSTSHSIPSVSLPTGQSSEVFIRVFDHDSNIEMFVIKDPSVCKDVRNKLTNLLNEQDPLETNSNERLIAIQLTRDKYWYRSERLVGGDRYFLIDFGKYVSSEEVEKCVDLPPTGFARETPAQAIAVNFFDDYKFSPDQKVLREIILLFKNKKVRIQPMGIHKNGEVLLRFEGAKGPNGKDLLEYFLEEGFVVKVSPPLQCGVDYELYEDIQHSQAIQKTTLSKGSTVFILDFMDSTDEVIVLEQKSILDRKEFQQKLQDGQYEPLDSAFVVENRVVLCRRKEDGLLYRGKILSLDYQRRKARLFLFDFGYLVLATFNDLYIMDKDLTAVPPFTHVLTLKNVDCLHIFDTKVFLKIRRLLPILSVPLVLTYICEKGIKAILKHPNGKTINHIVQNKLHLDEPHLCGEIEGQGRLNNFDYNLCLISELGGSDSSSEETTLLLHITSPKEIFATPLHALPLYQDFIRQTQAYCSIQSESSFYKPDLNQVVLAQYSGDSAWYRGVSLDKGFHILFADFGLIEKREPTQLQMMDSRLMELPFLSNHCVYKGFEELGDLEDEEFSFLRDLSYTKVSIRVLEVKDCYFVIEIPSIDDKMSALREAILSKA